MIWPFRKRETERRQQGGPYTDAIVNQILASAKADETAGDAGRTGALEAAAGVVARAFASAELMIAGAVSDRWPPDLLASIGRDLIVDGECLLLTLDGVTVRASHWDVMGTSPDPDRWRYRASVPAPDGERTINRAGAAVAHPRYSSDPQRPWIGVGPLGRAVDASALAGGLEQRMGQEAGSPVGHLLPIPAGGDDTSVSALKADLAKLNGRTAVVETTYGGWGEGRGAAPQRDWQPSRIGADWPSTTPAIHTAASMAVLAACGVPVELVTPADGTGQREAWRRCLHGTIEPLGRIAARELTRMVGLPVSLSFERLAASDIAGRARAFQSMVGAGMDPGAAASASGLMND